MEPDQHPDLPFVSAAAMRALVGPREAADAITRALRGGLDPGGDPARSSVRLPRGEFLLMPSQGAASAGVKVVTVAPANPGRGLPRIHGLYLLFDADTLAPVAVLEGAALTTLRTPAVPAAFLAATRDRLPDDVRLVVFGAGPQGIAHIDAIGALEGVRLVDVTLVARRGAAVVLPHHLPSVRVLAADDDGLRAAVRAADVVVCATTSRVPVVAADDVRAGATVVAIGSHERHVRELDGALLGRSTVVVEDVPTALREAGDVVLAVAEGHLDPADLVALADVVRGTRRIGAGDTVVLKTTGMAWEDLVVAEAVVRRRAATHEGA